MGYIERLERRIDELKDDIYNFEIAHTFVRYAPARYDLQNVYVSYDKIVAIICDVNS